jgi:Zn-dependent protease
MRTTWQFMSWRGVPILVHGSLLLGLPWFYVVHDDLSAMALAFLAFFLLLFVHELGHAAMAKWRRVPVVEIRLFLLHGYCEHEEARNPADAVWIAWGGVLAQGILLLLALLARELLQWQAWELYFELAALWYTLIGMNIVIIGVNLLPVPPLDGAKAWQVLPLTWKRLNSDVKRRREQRHLEQDSNRIAADIVERLKKRR